MPMRILLDECVHKKVAQALSHHSVKTVQQHGWSGVTNGELLVRAGAEFDAFITSDKNIQYQQHIGRLPMPVILLKTKGNTWSDVEKVIPSLEMLLSDLLENRFYFVE